MTFLRTVFSESSFDAVRRLRVSNPTTLFDSKQLHDADPRIWDDSEVSGSGTTSTHSTDEAATTMGVAGSTAGKRVRQTFMRFNYHPGKSQLILMTGVLDLSGGGTGITRAIGIFDDDNGIFFKDTEGTIQVVMRSSVSGSPVDTAVSQSSWTLDPMDGTDASSVNLDFSTAQIFIIDFEWLGTGRVRLGCVIDGTPVYCHEFNNANSLSSVYMSTPNLPLRYEIANGGTGVASTLLHICATVLSEGGAQEIGKLRCESTQGTSVNCAVDGTLYAILGMRQKSTHLDAVVREKNISVLSTDKPFEWVLIFNPTIAGTFTYSDLSDSVVQTAIGVTANTVTGGVPIDAGYGAEKASQAGDLNAAIWLGSAIDGTRDELVLCARPLLGGSNIYGAIAWRELV